MMRTRIRRGLSANLIARIVAMWTFTIFLIIFQFLDGIQTNGVISFFIHKKGLILPVEGLGIPVSPVLFGTIKSATFHRIRDKSETAALNTVAHIPIHNQTSTASQKISLAILPENRNINELPRRLPAAGGIKTIAFIESNGKGVDSFVLGTQTTQYSADNQLSQKRPDAILPATSNKLIHPRNCEGFIPYSQKKRMPEKQNHSKTPQSIDWTSTS